MVLECQVSLAFQVFLDSPVCPDFPVSLDFLVCLGYPDSPTDLDFLLLPNFLTVPDSPADLMVLLPTLNYLNDSKKSADTLYLMPYWSLSFS